VSELTKNSDEWYMQRCLQLASNGLGNVSTNPLVGCVIVHNNTIVGAGYHQQFGKNHAEVNAINSVSNKNVLPKSTLYVNLEPCAHYGNTPPCADLIAKYKIQRVVIGTVDTYGKVAGRGIEKLKSCGINVCVGVLENECRNQNRRFFCFTEKKRPFIILKWVQTADGFMGREHGDLENSKRISNTYTDIKVHKWRTEEDAILVGTNTALVDNPTLTARYWKGQNPVRVLIDFDLKVPALHNIYNSQAKTIVINTKKAGQEGTVFFEKVNNKDLKIVVNVLFQHKIQSVIIEGGAKLLQSFIDENLWDEARMIQCMKQWGRGIKAPALNGDCVDTEIIESDTISMFLPFGR